MLDFQQYFPYNEVFDFIKNNQKGGELVGLS